MNKSLNIINYHKKLYLIQALRGVAALLVVGHHLTTISYEVLNQKLLFGLFNFGYAGVDFFFVLSGFIILFVHYQDIGKKEKVKIFLTKRIVRIYPIYFLITSLVLPIYLMGYGKPYKRNIDVILKSYLLYPQDNYPILNIAWTLSYEVFFYILFSLAILLNPRITKFLLLSWTSILLSFLLIDLTADFRTDNTLISFLFNSRNLEFLLGCLCGFLVKKYNFSNYKFHIFSLGFILFLTFGLYDNFLILNIPPVVTYGLSSFLIVLGAALYDIYKPIKISQFATFLGDASYSIYLTHFVILSAFLILVNKLQIVRFISYPATMLLTALITLLIGCLVFKFIESPLLLVTKKHILNKLQQSNVNT